MYNDINLTNVNTEYINGFNVMPNDVLIRFAESEGLSFTPQQLFYIRDYFLNRKKALPTYSQLKFFSAVNDIRKKKKIDFPIFSASAQNGSAKEIMETSQDLLSKRSVIDKKVFGAMPISFAAEIASEYLKYLGVNEKNKYFSPIHDNVPNGYYINTDGGEPIFEYSDPDAPKNIPMQNIQAPVGSIGANNAIVMLCPLSPMSDDEYAERVNAFLTLPEIAPITTTPVEISAEYSLFSLLKNERNGVFADISRLPDIKKNEQGKIDSLLPLLNDCYGRRVFATNFPSLAIINRISGNFGLMLCHFAMKNDSKTITLDATRAPIFSFDFEFLDAMEEFKEPHEYIFSDESNLPIGQKEKIFLTDNRRPEKQSYRAERILNFGKIIASATSRELESAPFKTASITILDAITSLIAKGAAKNDISLLINYSLLGNTDDSIELGKNLSAILGAYRTMIELCVSDSNPKISYNTKKRSIAVLASAKQPIRKIKSTFSDGDTYLYLIPYKYDQNGFINYGAYRSTINEYYSIIEKDLVLSAFAVNENLATLLNGINGNVSVAVDADFDLDSQKLTHGILFESNVELSSNENFILIGKTVFNPLSDFPVMDNN